MQRPLRRAHWRFWLMLALVLPAILIVGLTVRQPRPVADTAFPPPAELARQPEMDRPAGDSGDAQ